MLQSLRVICRAQFASKSYEVQRRTMFVLSQSLGEEVTLLKIRGNVLGFHPARLAAVGYEGKFDTLNFSHMTKLCRVAVLDNLGVA